MLLDVAFAVSPALWAVLPLQAAKKMDTAIMSAISLIDMIIFLQDNEMKTKADFTNTTGM